MEDLFDNYAVEMDTECLYQDIDDVDLYGEKMVEDNTEETNILFE